jgi:acetyl-CoA carboxylase biotin carboxyl carrier protein
VDTKQIKELMALLEKSKLKKLIVKEKNGQEIHLEKHSEFEPPPVYTAKHNLVPHSTALPPQTASEPAPESAKTGEYITSPMVGTFYSSPAPGEPAFVKVGDNVNEDTVVCIVEAMKVMNEVKAGKKGVIQEVCHESGQAVEFGTKLFRIE